MSFFPCNKLRALVAIVTLAEDFMCCKHNNPKINNPKPLLCKAENYASNYLTLNHFKMFEDMGLKIIASRSP
jgi:hypothetical protein